MATSSLGDCPEQKPQLDEIPSNQAFSVQELPDSDSSEDEHTETSIGDEWKKEVMPSVASRETSTTADGAHDEESVAPHDWKSPFLKELGSEAVTFLVGKDREPFLIHKGRLCAVSDFFRAGFTGNFSEAIKKEMVLEDFKVSDFAKFTEWIYRGSFPSTHVKASLSKLINLYFLADRFRCNNFKNFVMDKLQDVIHSESYGKKLGTFLSYRQIKRIFRPTVSTVDSPIRKYCAASISHYLRLGGIREKVNKIFKLDGFANEYIEFQESVWKEEDKKTKYRKTLGLRSDSRIRKQESLSCELSDCECSVELHYGDALPKDKSGFPICSFHVHGTGDKCDSKSNYNSDCERDERDMW